MKANPKHDRQGVRRASEIEQKYDLSILSNLKGGRDNLDLSNLLQTVSQFIVQTNAKFDRLLSVGSIHISMDDADPSTIFGGTWELLAEGHLLVGIDRDNGLQEMFQTEDYCYIWKRIS